MIEILDRMTIVPLGNTAERLTMSDEEYFGKGLTDYVSNSLLGLINPKQGGSPEKFLSGFSDNKDKSSLQLGTAVHALVLEKDNYRLLDLLKPSGKVGLIFDRVYQRERQAKKKGLALPPFDYALYEAAMAEDYYTSSLTPKRIETLKEKGKEYLEYLRFEQKPGDIVLPNVERDKCIACVKAINRDRDITSILYPETDLINIHTFNEDVITMSVKVCWDDIELPIMLKAKVDSWSVDYDNKILYVNDLKTTGKPIDMFMGSVEKEEFLDPDGHTVIEYRQYPGSFQNFHYDRQMAMYGWMLWKYAEKEYDVDSTWRASVNIATVETVKDFNARLFRINKRWIDRGFREFQHLIKRVAFHRHYGFDKRLDPVVQYLFEL